MAKKGFTAHMDILEAETGFRRAFLREGGPSEESMVNSLHSGLWDITSGGGVTIKLFPSCGGTHKAISAVIGLANREDIKPADVKSVVIKNQEWVFKVAHIIEPKTGLEGKFSVEFTVAVALTYRAVGMEHFTDAKVKELEPLMKKISREVDTAPAEGPHVPTTATITMADGRVFANTVNYQTGHAENPLTWEELFRKYRGCMALHFPEEEIAKSWEMLIGLERVERFRDLIAVFTK
jgi:2-methylcitrate dehydratase PrpD